MEDSTTYVFYLNLVAQLPPFGSSKFSSAIKRVPDKALTRLGQGNILERPNPQPCRQLHCLINAELPPDFLIVAQQA